MQKHTSGMSQQHSRCGLCEASGRHNTQLHAACVYMALLNMPTGPQSSAKTVLWPAVWAGDAVGRFRGRGLIKAMSLLGMPALLLHVYLPTNRYQGSRQSCALRQLSRCT
jgi:hypothetical protein